MEIAGLTLGAVALISLFKDCVDLFSMITAARQLGEDAAIMDTKLDVEKMLFLQWSDRVGLLKQHEVEHPLSNPGTQQIVSRVLTSIKVLLSEGEALQKVYGLRKVDSTDSPHPTRTKPRVYSGASAFGMSRFLREFEKLNITSRQQVDPAHPSRISNASKRIRWIIVDKEKFDSLISNLSYFNSSLAALVPLTSTSALASSKEDLSHVNSLAELNTIIKASANLQPTVEEAAIVTRRTLIQSQVLQRLWFRWYDDRRLNVKDPHFETLHWALDPPDDYLKWDDLNTWLQMSSGIYWISGKAGSGKSTLMKHLHGHQRTHDLLNTWAGHSELVLASFFFYALGRSEQKSQSGLLRSLLYQILKHDKESIETVLPIMWSETCYANEDNPLATLSIPSVAEMTVALKSLCASCDANKKLCLLIDGIDEYEGQDLDVASFIREIGSFPNVKILVSSRPHPAFVSAFSRNPKMNLPDLTKHDIASYVDNNVTSHPYMVTLAQIEPDNVKAITTPLVDKAAGVFLWVVLACRSVVEGCDDYSTVSDLKARVDELPKEVEDLLQHLLDQINPRWEQEAMKLMNLVYTNQCHEDIDPIPTLGLYLACEQGLEVDIHSSRINLEKVPVHQVTAKCDIMEGRLRSRCCGLIEVQWKAYEEHEFCGHDDGEINGCIRVGSVGFMHRTVYDLLSQPHVSEREFGKIRDKGFRSYTILSTLWCQLIASSRYEMISIGNALHYMHFDDENGGPPANIIHCLSMIQFICRNPALDYAWPEATEYLLHDKRCRKYCDDLSLVLVLAAEMGLTRVIQFAFEDTGALGSLLVRPPDLESLGDCQNENRGSCNSLHCRPGDCSQGSLTGQLNTKFPILYHAICKPLLHEMFFDIVDTLAWSTDPPSLQLAQYILAMGLDPVQGTSKIPTARDGAEEAQSGASNDTTTQEKPRVTLQGSAAILSLDSLRFHDLSTQFDKLCQPASDFEDEVCESEPEEWKKIREAIYDRLQHTPSDHELPVWEESKTTAPEERPDSNSRKRLATDDCKDSSTKKRQLYMLISQNTDEDMDLGQG
ncbi:hypothetical protein ACHAPJ_009421 [Fusarium lateritium]